VTLCSCSYLRSNRQAGWGFFNYMAQDKKSFIMYCDLLPLLEKLSDDEAGKLFKHLLRYVNDLNPEPPDRITEVMFEPIKQQLKRDLKDWELSKELKSIAGKIGMESRWKKHNELKQGITDDNSVIKSITDITVSVNGNVNDSGSDILIKEEKPKIEKDPKPTLEEFIAYYKSELEKEFPNLLFSIKTKYETWVDAGWKDGNGQKIKNWRLKLKNTIPHLKPVFTNNSENQQPTKISFK